MIQMQKSTLRMLVAVCVTVFMAPHTLWALEEADDSIGQRHELKEVEIVNIRKLYKERQSRELGLLESYIYTDSVAEITFHVVDTSSATHSYRLKALGVSYAYPIPLYEDTFWPEIVTWTSSYFSTDPLLYDSQITDMFGPWQAYTTDIFTNRQFKKEAYITVQVRYPYAIRDYHRFVQIELQPITNSLANYLSAIYRIRVAKQSYYSDYTTLPSNIDGGVGIFGGIGKSTKLRIWLDGEDPNYP